jgi:hypothetical protein
MRPRPPTGEQVRVTARRDNVPALRPTAATAAQGDEATPDTSAPTPPDNGTTASGHRCRATGERQAVKLERQDRQVRPLLGWFLPLHGASLAIYISSTRTRRNPAEQGGRAREREARKTAWKRRGRYSAGFDGRVAPLWEADALPTELRPRSRRAPASIPLPWLSVRESLQTGPERKGPRFRGLPQWARPIYHPAPTAAQSPGRRIPPRTAWPRVLVLYHRRWASG